MKFIRKNLILKSMMVIGTLALSIGGSLSFYYIDQEMKAETVQIDDGPLGEKIVDIEIGSRGNALFALTEKGEVYAWGCNDYNQLGTGITGCSLVPKKVLSPVDSESKYLNNISKVISTTNATFAISTSGDLYGWGSNDHNKLGLDREFGSEIARKIPIDFKVIDVKGNKDATFLLSQDGNVFVAGYENTVEVGGLLGIGVGESSTFTQLLNDVNGNPLPLIKEIKISGRNSYFLTNDGNIYSSGRSDMIGTGANTNLPKKALLENDVQVSDIDKIISVSADYGEAIVRRNDNEIYISACRNPGEDGYIYVFRYTPLSKYILFTDTNNIFQNVVYFDASEAGNTFLSSDQKAYKLNNYNSSFPESGSMITVVPYIEGDITADYNNVKKVISGYTGGSSYPTLLLSNNGGVYYNGQKVTFGDLLVSGIKNNNQSYKSDEKYNDDISLNVSVGSDKLFENVRYDLVDLTTGSTISENMTPTETINITVEDNEHINLLYKFYFEGEKDTSLVEYKVDLYKSIPQISDVKNNGVYKTGKTINLGYNGISNNLITAEISKDNGSKIEYISNTPITDVGDYTLSIKDQYGNTNSYKFSIVDEPVANSVVFTKSNGELIFSNQITKENQIIGDLSLKYDDETVPYTIKTISIDKNDPTTQGSHFDIVNGNQLKVIGSDLNAGTYKISVSGIDTNNMPFNDIITIVIEKADQPDYKIVTGVKQEEVYGFIFKLNDTIQIGTKGKLSGGTETLTITSGNGTIASLKGTNPESFEMLAIGKFTIEVTIAGDTNYKEKTISQEITLSDKEVQKGFGITSADQMIYGSTYQPAANGGESDGAISWSITNDNGTSAIINLDGTISVSAIGTFTLTAKKAGNAVYQDVSDSITVTVNPLSISVKPNNVSIKTGQAFTDQGVSHTPSIISGDASKIGTPVITTAYQVGDGAGTYDITITGGLANPNYTFTYAKGTLTVKDVTLPDNGDQDKSPYYEVTGTKGKNGWYTSDIQIKTTGKDGYTKISQTNGSFTGDTITVSSEGETDISLYFQNTDGTITKPITYKAKIDKTAPSIPTMTVDEINTSRIARLLNMLSFGSWMNKEAQVTMLSNDGISGIDHYEYIETIKGSDSQPKSSAGTINYGDETELMLKARACDKAGNCSTYSNSEELKIDKKGPTILGVKDQSVYKQYYSPRFVTVTDLVSGLKQATYKKDGNPAGAFADNVETPIKGEGSYEIYAIDEAGNEITITFKILKLPNIDTEIDGSDESRDLIDQIIKEYEEIKDKIDSSEKDEYEEWIKDAEDKWEFLRKKVIEHEETTSKVEGQGDTTFDPSTKLIVEEIPKDKVPVLPRNAIKTYDVRLMKGDKKILPNGDIKVYLPYTEQEAPIVYEIDTDGTITELPSQQENGYVTFITNTLKKYAISNAKQEENKDPDDNNNGGNDNQKPTPNPDDGNGDNNGNDNQNPTPNPDDGNDPDNNKPDPNPDDGKNPDDNNDPTDDDQVCSVGPDGKPNTSDDVCGKPNEDGDKPIVNPDGSITIPDGGSVIFPDGSEVELPDGGTIKPDGSVELPDGTEYDKDGNKKDPDKKQCDIKGKYLNIDSDGDGRPDVNLDINGDCYPDINIDTDNDGYPNVNIDTTGDGKPNINVDTDNDGKADLNIVLKLPAWKPELNTTVDGFAYDTMGGIEPDLNIDTSGDGKPNINVDTDGDGNPDQNVEDDWYEKRGLEKPKSNTDVKGSYTDNTGGVSTGDNTKWYIWLFLMFCTLSTMGYNFYRKHKMKK